MKFFAAIAVTATILSTSLYAAEQAMQQGADAAVAAQQLGVELRELQANLGRIFPQNEAVRQILEGCFRDISTLGQRFDEGEIVNQIMLIANRVAQELLAQGVNVAELERFAQGLNTTYFVNTLIKDYKGLYTQHQRTVAYRKAKEFGARSCIKTGRCLSTTCVTMSVLVTAVLVTMFIYLFITSEYSKTACDTHRLHGYPCFDMQTMDLGPKSVLRCIVHALDESLSGDNCSHP